MHRRVRISPTDNRTVKIAVDSSWTRPRIYNSWIAQAQQGDPNADVLVESRGCKTEIDQLTMYRDHEAPDSSNGLVRFAQSAGDAVRCHLSSITVIQLILDNQTASKRRNYRHWTYTSIMAILHSGATGILLSICIRQP